MFGTKKRLKKMQETTERDLIFVTHMANVYKVLSDHDPSNLEAMKQYKYYDAQKDIVQTILDRFESKK